MNCGSGSSAFPQGDKVITLLTGYLFFFFFPKNKSGGMDVKKKKKSLDQWLFRPKKMATAEKDLCLSFLYFVKHSFIFAVDCVVHVK